jgi:hypothetical protein
MGLIFTAWALESGRVLECSGPVQARNPKEKEKGQGKSGDKYEP